MSPERVDWESSRVQGSRRNEREDQVSPLAILLVALVGGQASGASAHPLAKGTSYGCQMHSNVKVLQAAPKPVKRAVTGVHRLSRTMEVPLRNRAMVASIW
jgi:hypothetical protein